jgi:hypothetical protein
MVARKVNLKEAAAQVTAVKTLLISLGMPMNRVRTMDDALRVIEQLEARSNNVRKAKPQGTGTTNRKPEE